MPEFRELSDTKTTRKFIFQRVQDALKSKFPIEGKNYSLNLVDLKLPQVDYSLAEQKKALLEDRDLHVPIRGMVQLVNNASGEVVDKKRVTLAHIPYYTGRGTFIYGGNEYTVANQQRLKPGAYTRVKENGDIETHFNLQAERGFGFRLNLEPKTGIFRMQVGQANLKLYPILKAMGVDDQALEKYWGKDVTDINRSEADDPKAVDKLYTRLYKYRTVPNLSVSEKASLIADKLSKSYMDPDVTSATLGKPYTTVSTPVLLDATQKILRVRRGEEDIDDRDSMKFRTIHGIDDYMEEHIRKDAGRITPRLMQKIEETKSLKPMSAGIFTPQLRGLIIGDSRSMPLEEINPLQLLDQQQRIIALGEGGIGSMDAVPDEARNVHPSQFGFIDPVNGPESEGVGVDVRIAHDVLKGTDRKLYRKVINAKTGKSEIIPVDVFVKSTVAFPNEWESKSDKVQAMSNEKMTVANRRDVDYILPNASSMFSALSNTIPMVNNTLGQRLLMATKAIPQALPLAEPEAPLIRSRIPGSDMDFDTLYGRKIAARTSKTDGQIVKIDNQNIYVRDKDGNVTPHEMYYNFPFNRKTRIHSTPVVKPGQQVRKGDLLAKTNFTDDDGALALGRNLRVAYIPFKGYNYEDAILVSESAAKKLSSEHLYQHELSRKDNIVDKHKYVSYFPTNFNVTQFKTVDGDGVVLPGTIVKNGDPLILGMQDRVLSATDISLGKLHKILKQAYNDTAITWDYPTDGEVLDVVKTGKTVKVNVKTVAPLEVGDKLTARYGNKGVVSNILPDDQMPRIGGPEGSPIEVALNPMGVISRINPAQIYETLLGKVADKTGKPYKLEPFGYHAFTAGSPTLKFSAEDSRPIFHFVKSELDKHGLKDTDDLFDPVSGKTIPGVLTGKEYVLKLSKTAISGLSERETGRYTADLRPAKGGEEGAKKVENMIVNALVGHGALENLREMATLKAEKNDELWRAVRLGYPLPSPKTPFIYHKFIDSLRAAGVNVFKKGDIQQLLPMTDRDTTKISSGEIKNSKLLSARNLEPEKGGLFDEGLTGGPIGTKWTHISLNNPLPSPVMEKPIMTLLGLTENKYRDVISGKESLEGTTGGKAIQKALSKIDVDEEIDRLRKEIKTAKGTSRDKAIKALWYLTTAKNTDMKLKDFVIGKVPVIPPIYRPVSVTKGDTIVVSDANRLYKDLINSNQVYGELKKDLPEEALTNERLHLYDSLKAVTGLGDPTNAKDRAKNVKGFISQIVGSQPKYGMFQAKVMAKTQDLAGRSVIVPDPTLNMDEVSLPQDMAWKIFKPFIMRRLVTQGMPATIASNEIEKRSPRALVALETVMAERPVILNRAPTLHKFNVLAFKPVLNTTKSMGIPAFITSGFNADFDGDAMQVYVPVTESARKEALDKLLPSRNLFALKEKTPMFLPLQEAILGLYMSTRGATGEAKKFRNKQEVISAYQQGKLLPTDVIEIPDN